MSALLIALEQGGAPSRRLRQLEAAASGRRIARLFCVVFFSSIALLQMGLMLPFIDPKGRAHWLHRWCRFACRVLNLRLTIEGMVPNTGMLVCNHLSYLDIIALSALRPAVFVAKRDLRGWPLFGWLARAAGTIFVDRHSRTAARHEVRRIASTIKAGLLVVLFPEGTSSDGASVLPFKSSLLQSAVESNCPIAAAAIDYRLADGSVPDDVCYWRDMTLVPHLLNLFGKRAVASRVRFSPSRIRGRDRKALARELQAEVVALRR